MILIVEDDNDLREVLGEILGNLGYQVSLARHGVAALEFLRTIADTTPHVILL